MKHLCKTAVALLATALFATPLLSTVAEAQAPLDVRAYVGTGLLMPQGALVNAPVLASPTNVFSFDEFDASASINLGLEVGPMDFPASLRVLAARSLGTGEVGVWGCADAAGDPLPCPSILIEAQTDVTATAVAADVVGSLEIGRVELRPLLGVGWVRYAYSWDPGSVGSFSLEPGGADDDSLAFHYGAAVGVALGRLRLDIEYSGYRTQADRVRPHDTRSVSVGLAVPIS